MKRSRLGPAFVAVVLVLAGVAAARPGTAHAASGCPWVGATDTSPEQRAAQVLAQMTLDDKISEVHGQGGSPYVGWVPAIPRLCVPAISLEDGPAGVADGMNGVTQLPAPVAAAASFDTALTKQYGTVVGAEEASKGANVDLGPTVNIVRDPRWGRAFESYGEDPYLAGQMGVADITGVQGQGILAQVKHLAAYNQETNRNTAADNAQVSERALQELYLPQFQAAVTQGGASSVMCSYSWINGTDACANDYLQNQVLKDSWGFDGFVTSDWGATHSTVPSALGGLDMQMPDGGFFGAALKQAVLAGQVPMSRLNDMVTRILTQLFRFGLFDRAPSGSPSAVVTSDAHAAVARQVAEDGTVLLKNDGALPLDGTTLHHIAVVGDDAGPGAMSAGGGSAAVNAAHVVTPLDGITARAGSGVDVRYAPGPTAGGRLPVVAAQYFGAGLTTQFYPNMTLSGSPVATRTDATVDANWNDQPPAPGVPANQWSARFTGTLTAPTTGTYTFSLTSDDGSRLFIGGQQVIDNWRDQPTTTKTGTVTLTAGVPVTVEADFYQNGGGDEVHLGWQPPGAPDPITQAADLARSSDVAVVFASKFESEGGDVSDIDLPNQQNQLITAVAQANPNTIVVLNTGSAVTMPWINQVKGVFEAWYPGQDDGTAIAALLFGDVDPSGKLPVTFPRSLTDVPANTPAQWPGVNGQVQYSEGLQVGYRWYDAQQVTPLFAFGHGLSYTSFGFSGLSVTPDHTTSRGTVTVHATVTNTGTRAGADVAQVYVGAPSATGEPPKALHGFTKVSLQPGQSRQVTFQLDPSAFSYWNDQTHNWAVADGDYQILVGDAADNLPLHGQLSVERTYGPQWLDLSAPATITAGGSGTVTATLHNDADVALTRPTIHLSTPGGWSPHQTGAPLPTTIAPHSSTKVSFTLTAPAGAAPGVDTVGADASYVVDGVGLAHANATATIRVPYGSFPAAYNNAGVSDDSAPASGSLDGSGYSFSAQALASVGITPGGTVTAAGATFTWPNVPAGTPDNVSAAGQVVQFSGTGSRLAFLGCGTFGTQIATVTLTYTDGSTSTGTISLADWYANAASTGNTLAVTAHWNAPANTTLDPHHPVSLYASTVPLSAGKTLAQVTLPSDSNMHLFAVAMS